MKRHASSQALQGSTCAFDHRIAEWAGGGNWQASTTRPLRRRARRKARLSIRFELFQAEAQHVFLAGSFNGWREDATPMSDSGGGHWMVDVPLSPGRYEYRFVVDGAWVTDPVAARYAANPFGGLNAIIHI